MTVFKYVFAVWACLTFATVSVAQDQGFTTIAPHAIIMDYDTGTILYEKDARTAVAPASMTKIMTAEIVFEKIRNGTLTLDTEFSVSEEAWRRGGAASGSSTMFLQPKSNVRVEDLLRGVIIQSGNDACIVLAENISGSEAAFADLMTARARDMGLSSATFKNSTGWPDADHVISLHDLAKLAEYSIREFPEFYKLYAERDFTWNGITQSNRNPLLGRFDGADGLKTGHTEASGYGLVASAKRADSRRIVVVNGLESKAQRSLESNRLMLAAFENFKVIEFYGNDAVVGSVDVYMGQADSVNAVTAEKVVLGVDRSLEKNMTVTFKSRQSVPAPVTRGDYIADLIVEIPGREPVVHKLLAAEDVKRKSAFGRAMTSLLGKF